MKRFMAKIIILSLVFITQISFYFIYLSYVSVPFVHHRTRTIRPSMRRVTEQEPELFKPEDIAKIMSMPRYQKRRYPRASSLCSYKATRRGLGQKVVSFSFFGPADENQGYLYGVKDNAHILLEFYPTWVMRVYHAVQESDFAWRLLLTWEQEYKHLFLCNVSSLPVLGNVEGRLETSWRFIPMADPLVDVFVSRDLDSRPSLREAAAVAQWLSSNYSFHVMRDHPYHQAPILGGMWGARKDIQPKLVRRMFTEISKFTQGHDGRGMDQRILEYVFEPLEGKVMQHDSFFCSLWVKCKGGITPFPTQRSNDSYNFVGARFGIDEQPITSICPKECRPKFHPEWTMC